jgi:hypothetical protein
VSRGALIDRLVFGAIALGATAVLVVARLLAPLPGGVGTHRALGLPPCGFLVWSGLPCPSCGLTTAFAHLAHFELAPALRAHPLGLPLFVLTTVLVPLAVRAVARGDALLPAIERFAADRIALGLTLALLFSWLARLIPRLG